GPERPLCYHELAVPQTGGFGAGFHKAGFELRYRDLVENFRLEPTAKLKNLSKGGYAKVGLALALAIDPEVLLLDEPTSGLDLLTRREFLTRMIHLAGDGRTILISSHQIAELERIDRQVEFVFECK